MSIYDEDYDDYEDEPLNDEEAFNRQYYASSNQREHKCQGCGGTFRAYYGRGPLAYCDMCADRIEAGLEF